ncbi:hypothetical protein ES705_06390 [subsurface metagenome]
MSNKEKREKLLKKIEACKGDFFLIYGYARQLEELDKKQNK